MQTIDFVTYNGKKISDRFVDINKTIKKQKISTPFSRAALTACA